MPNRGTITISKPKSPSAPRRKRAQARPIVSGGAAPSERRSNRINLGDLAYERIEDLIVNCELKPGRFLAMQDLQAATDLGRTPVHQAVSRLAADTLIIVQPRHGLQIAPIDLARERVLLRLRADIERFVVRLAAERAGSSQHHQLVHLARTLRERREGMTIDEFNALDRRIDRLIITAADEPFLEHTLRPLHTLFRRVGCIYHSQLAKDPRLNQTIDCHLAVLDAIANHQIKTAMAASDALIHLVEQMLDVVEREADPALLDCSF